MKLVWRVPILLCDTLNYKKMSECHVRYAGIAQIITEGPNSRFPLKFVITSLFVILLLLMFVCFSELCGSNELEI